MHAGNIFCYFLGWRILQFQFSDVIVRFDSRDFEPHLRKFETLVFEMQEQKLRAGGVKG